MKKSYASWVILPIALAACSPESNPQSAIQDSATFQTDFPNSGDYEASPPQLRVDRSFSTIPINTLFANVADQLERVDVGDCWEFEECNWEDEAGVSHYFFKDRLVSKTIVTGKWEGRPIPALGIGIARQKSEVFNAVKGFLPDVKIMCGEAFGMTRCEGMLLPGWFTLWFDESGALVEVNFEGYDFT